MSTCKCMSLVDITSMRVVSAQYYTELSPRVVADAFYNGELESEIRFLIEEHPTLQLDDFPFNTDADREHIMEQVESFRDIYPHNSCTSECKERGEV